MKLFVDDAISDSARRWRHRRSKASGSILVIVLVACTLVGITLASYLQLVSNQNLSIMRSMAWNKALVLAEAGIEEALAHLNSNITNRTQDGWVLVGTNVTKERTLGDDRYRVWINKDQEPPLILSEGYAKHPLSGEFLSPRTIRVSTTNDALFAKGLVAKGKLDLAGNGIRTDSYISTDPNFSTAGKYDPAKNKDGGDIATNSSVEDSMDVWNAEILGTASTGPNGNVKLGQNGRIGSKTWHSANSKGIQPGWAKDDMNVYFPNVKAPFNGGAFNPASGTVSNVNYKYLLGAGNYQISQLKLQASETMLVTGNTTLYVTSEIDIAGSGKIEIAPGATLQLYMAGAVTKIAGNGIANNGVATSFSYWGLPSNTQVSLSGNASLAGTVYAPQALLTLGGGGSNTSDFMGAAVANSIKLNGHFHFHYDESLKIHGPKRGYIITSWAEGGW